MTARHALAIAAALVLMTAPAASAQTPGDEQYTDPFGGSTPSQPERSDGTGGGSQPAEPDPSSGGGGESSGAGTVEPAPTAAPAVAPAAPSPPTTAAADQQLPRTGADTGLLALGGAALLAGGVALRVTLRERGPRRR